MKHKDLLVQLVKTDFKMRYHNSALGFVWVLLKPFLLFLILYLVFSFIFGARDPNYRLNLLLGLIIFYFFSEATTKGMNSLLDRANVILKINFPRHIAILASTINSLVSLFLSLIIFFIFWLFTPTPVTIWWSTFIFYLAIFTFFVLGFSFFASILLVKFRDLGAIWEVALSALFYLTPIIYPFAVVPEKFQRILVLNPLTTMIRDARLILIGGQPPGLYSFLYLTAVSLIFFIAGYFYFKNNVKKIAERI